MKIIKPLNYLIIVIYILLNANYISANSDDIKQVIKIAANKARLDDKQGIATYMGDVIIEQGTLKINADEVIIKRNQKKEADLFIATGAPALYQQELDNKNLVKAHANTIEYHISGNLVKLLKNAQIESDGNVFTGEQIIYDITAQVINSGSVAQKNKPNSRINIIIQPQKHD